MPKFEKTLNQVYPTPIAAARGFLDELIGFMETSGVTITNKVNADTTTLAKTTFDITAPCQVRIEYTAYSTPYSSYATTSPIIMRVLTKNGTPLVTHSNQLYRTTLANGTQLNSNLVLVLTDDYLSLWDKNGSYISSYVSQQKVNWLTAIKAKNLCTDSIDWFYSLNQYSNQSSNYVQADIFYNKFGALGANGSIIPGSSTMNKPRAKSPFPTGDKYSIRPMEFYDTHVAVSTYMCYGMGDEIFSTFTSGNKTFYRDMLFLNEI